LALPPNRSWRWSQHLQRHLRQDLQLYLQLERDQDITGINNLVSRLGVSGTRQLMAERDAYRGAR
jgi:hypothetical protein